MEKKKGFTLIELLAVIVILAIIALITTPMILGVIEKAKTKSMEASALGYIDAIEKQIIINEVDTAKEKVTDGIYEVSTLDVKVKGEKPSEGWVQLEKGQVIDYSLKINDYVVTYKEETQKAGTLKEQPIGDYKSYRVGEEISFDAGDGIIRTWNVLKEDSSSKSTVVLMLNENLGNPIAWNSTGENTNEPITAMNYLKEQTESWKNASNIRLITYDEIQSFVILDDENYTSLPTWLYQNTGCSVDPILSYNDCMDHWINSGYWTSSGNSNSGNRANVVRYYGVPGDVAITDDSFGIRPVITVSKNMISK